MGLKDGAQSDVAVDETFAATVHLNLEGGRFAQQRLGVDGLALREQVNVQRKERADLLAAIALPELQLLAQGGLEARWRVGGSCWWSG